MTFLLGCQSSGEEGGTAKSAATGPQQNALASLAQIKPLDDPKNPYRGKYQEWDNWIAANAVSVTAPGINPNAMFDFNPEKNAELTGHIVHLDTNGYLIPLIEDCKLFEMSKVSEQGKADLLRLRKVSALGKIDPELYQRSVDAYEEARAAFHRRIPVWLAENPPMISVLLPNGDIATKGMLGSGLGEVFPASQSASATLAKPGEKQSTGCCGGKGDNPGWFRYSEEGELLGSTTRDYWWYLYFDPDIQDLPRGHLNIRNDGYAIFTDGVNGPLLAVLDWDGTELPTVMPAQRAIQPFNFLNPRRLKSYYAAQQRILNGTAAPGISITPVLLSSGTGGHS